MYPQYPNPINDFYFRNAQLQAQQSFGQSAPPLAPLPQYQNAAQFNPNPAPQNPNLITRYVTNIEEAKAAMIDGLSTYLFIDAGSGKIYLKKMNNNGLSDFYTYIVDESGTAAKALDPMQQINARLQNIENTLGDLKNDKSVQCNANVSKSARRVNAAAPEQNESNAATESGALPKSNGND